MYLILEEEKKRKKYVKVPSEIKIDIDRVLVIIHL